ncbi:MAG: LuxR C-terminal-related transcriptional regulator [Nevskiales bacterium]|nr:LuxR C-terminal-related transcriptional regulator [Nevskiales bacterium]
MRLESTASGMAPVEVYPHKFFAPPPYEGAVERSALIARVHAEPTLRVIVVQAPAGYGKSTLLQQIMTAAGERGELTGWLSFDEADNDSRRLTGHLQALVAGLNGSDAATLSGGIADEQGRRRLTDWLLSRLVQLERPVSLFLDEFQSLTRKPALAVFKDLLQRLPENVTIYIGSRSVPEIGLARLVVNHQALVLRAEDLRFNAAEVQHFFSFSRDAVVNADELDAILRRTEGWPAAIQLFRLSLASPSVRRSLGEGTAGRPRELADYLADNVLELQPPRIQEFLLRTSVLSRLSAELCDEINGWQDSQSILLFLERSGLFLRSLDSELRWFKYHTLFSTFLSEQLREQAPEEVIEIHRRAARWFEAHEQYEEAMQHAVAARDHGYAADIMNRWASGLIPDARLTTVERWSDRLPLAEIEKRPDLAVKTAWALTFMRRNQKLQPIIDIPERLGGGDIRRTTSSDVVNIMLAVARDDLPLTFEYLDRVPLEDQRPEGFWAFELGAAANVAAFRAQIRGDYDAARDFIAMARAYGDKGSSAFSGGYTVALSAINCLAQGRLGDALKRFAEGLSAQRPDLDESLASGSLVSCYVWALYEANRLDEAASLFKQFHDVISDAVLPDFVAVAYVSMARAQAAAGRDTRAQQVLEELEEIGHAAAWPRLVRIAGWERVRLALLDGDVDRARTVAGRLPQAGVAELPEGWMTFSESIEADQIGACRLAIHEGRLDEALQTLSREEARAQTQGRVHRQIKLLLLEACAHTRRGADNLALRSLSRAVQLARAGGYVRSFIDEGAPVVALLRQILPTLDGTDADTRDARAFVESLLAAAGVAVAPGRAAANTVDSGFQPLEPLTEREKEMLVFLGNGVSNKEMAKKLFVSENTVKFHLKNIYSKLAVGSRLQAINAARQLGLL